MKFKRIIVCGLIIMLIMISTNAIGDTKLSKGTYLVGKDIEAGDYELTCTELDDDKYNDLAVDILTSISGGSELAGSFWSAVGSQTEKKPLAVTIKDKNGKTVNLGSADFTLGDDNRYYADSAKDIYSLLSKNGLAAGKGWSAVRNTLSPTESVGYNSKTGQLAVNGKT